MAIHTSIVDELLLLTAVHPEQRATNCSSDTVTSAKVCAVILQLVRFSFVVTISYFLCIMNQKKRVKLNEAECVIIREQNTII